MSKLKIKSNSELAVSDVVLTIKNNSKFDMVINSIEIDGKFVKYRRKKK